MWQRSPGPQIVSSQTQNTCVEEENISLMTLDLDFFVVSNPLLNKFLMFKPPYFIVFFWAASEIKSSLVDKYSLLARMISFMKWHHDWVNRTFLYTQAPQKIFAYDPYNLGFTLYLLLSHSDVFSFLHHFGVYLLPASSCSLSMFWNLVSSHYRASNNMD